MHECLSVQDWIRLWGHPEAVAHRLAECPACWPLREDLAAWTESVSRCEDCSSSLETALLDEEHLNCPSCMESFTQLHELVEGLEHFDPALASEILSAQELFAKLDRLPLNARIGRVTDDPRYHQWGLAQRLLGASKELWCSDPNRAHEHGTVAVAVAELLDPTTYHPLWVADLRAKAHAYLGNTHRIRAEFPEAEREFLAAEGHVWRGTGSGHARTTVFSLKASLHIDQHRFVEASLLLESVLAFYERAEDPAAIGRTCLKLARVEEAREEFGAAARLCLRALSYLDHHDHRRLWVLAQQNAVEYTIAAGDARQGRALFDDLPSPVDRSMELRRLWIEGNLFRAEGEPGAARVAYGAARAGFAEDGQHYLAALVSLEEAALALDEGESLTALEAAQEASILLVRGAARQEAIAVLRVLLDSLERGMADRALVLTLARRIAALQPS